MKDSYEMSHTAPSHEKTVKMSGIILSSPLNTGPGFSVYSGHIVFSLPGCTQLLSMFVWEKKCFSHHWVVGWGFVFFSLLVICLSLGWVILYWLVVSSFNAPWLVRHQAFYLLLRPRLRVISCSHSHSSATRSSTPEGTCTKIQTAL